MSCTTECVCVGVCMTVFNVQRRGTKGATASHFMHEMFIPLVLKREKNQPWKDAPTEETAERQSAESCGEDRREPG